MLAMLIGQTSNIQVADAAAGSLSSTSGQWVGTADDNGATITVVQAGDYVIEVCGGASEALNGDGVTFLSYISTATGGKLSGIASLNTGDVIKAVVLDGGYSRYARGGKAVIIYVNDIPVIGAGGGGGYGYYYVGPAHSTGIPTTAIDNTKFSSGAGGNDWAYSGKVGNTIAGCTPAPIGGDVGNAGTVQNGNGKAGYNYLDNDLINLIEQPNGSTVVGFSVKYKKQTEEDNPETFNRIATAEESSTTKLERIAVALESGNNHETPAITVIKGQSFNVGVGYYDDAVSASVNGISLVNDIVGDGVVRLTGVVNTAGITTVNINGKKFIITAIEEPSSSNIIAVF